MSVNIEYTMHRGRFAAIIPGTALALAVHVPAVAETAVRILDQVSSFNDIATVDEITVIHKRGGTDLKLFRLAD